MKKKIMNKKTSSQNFTQRTKKNETSKQFNKSPVYKAKSPSKSLKNKKQKSQLSIKISTPPLVSRITKISQNERNHNNKDYSYNKQVQGQLASPSHVKNHKAICDNFYDQKGSDYLQMTPSKLKSEMKWTNINKRNSSVNEQICHQYGYSNLSHAKLKSQNSQRNSLKKQKNKSQKSQIQRLMTKYKKHLDKDDSSRGSSKSKETNFRTLSTDDKSQKKLNFTKNNKKVPKKIISNSPQKKKKISLKINILSTKKKNQQKTLLPDYFGCLSINKVQSQLETLKSKEGKQHKNTKNPIDSNQTTADRFKKESTKQNKVFSARSSSSNFLKSENSKVSSFKKKTSTHLLSNNLKQIIQKSVKKV